MPHYCVISRASDSLKFQIQFHPNNCLTWAFPPLTRDLQGNNSQDMIFKQCHIIFLANPLKSIAQQSIIKYKTDNISITKYWGAFTKPLLPWRSSITYFCVCEGARARVCVRVRARACTFARVALLTQHATYPVCNAPPYSHLRPL
jgi:hypothetical protein